MSYSYWLDNGEDTVRFCVDDYEVEQIDESYKATMAEDFFIYNVTGHIETIEGQKVSDVCLLRSAEIEIGNRLLKDIIEDEFLKGVD